MSEQTTEEIEREEIEMLLPWYATGQLGRADRERVESYLAGHPEMLRQLDLVRTERDETVAANESLGAPSAGAIDRLMAALPSTRGRRTPFSPGAVFFQRVADFFVAPTAAGVRWAAVAVAALIALQAATIGALLHDRGVDYEAASGQETGDGITALVVFTDEATAPAISRLLAEFGANIVDGPKPGGVYKVRLRMEDRSPAAREARLRALAEQRDIVRTVLPSRD
jgi:anti-sigma factor RsiW